MILRPKRQAWCQRSDWSAPQPEGDQADLQDVRQRADWQAELEAHEGGQARQAMAVVVWVAMVVGLFGHVPSRVVHIWFSWA